MRSICHVRSSDVQSRPSFCRCRCLFFTRLFVVVDDVSVGVVAAAASALSVACRSDVSRISSLMPGAFPLPFFQGLSVYGQRERR